MTKNKSVKEIAELQAITLDRRGDNLDTRLLELAFEPIMVRHFNGQITFWNRGAADLYGYEPNEALGALSHELLNTVFSTSQQDIENQILETGVWIGMLTHTTKDGRKLIIESRHQLFELEHGKKLVLETNRDITARESQYRTLFEGMQEGAGFCQMIYDGQGQPIDWIYMDVNPALEDLLGKRKIVGAHVCELFPRLKETNPDVFERYGRVAKTGVPENFETYVRPLNKWLYVSAFSPYPNHFIAILKDISVRKQEEGELSRSRNQLKSFVEYMPAAVAMLDRNLCYVSCSRRWREDYDLGDQNLIGRDHYDVFPEIRDKSDWQSVHQRALAGEVIAKEEDKFVRGDGSVSWLKWEVRPWFDQSGEIGGILILTEDITDSKLSEMRLQVVNNRLEHLMSSSPVVIYTCLPTEDFGATFISNNVTRLVGYTPDEFIEHSGFWAEHIHPDDAPRVFAELPKLFEVGHHSHEYRFLHKDGTYRWMLDELRLVRDKDGWPMEIVGAWNDITDKKRAEVELGESEQSLRLALDSAEMGMWEWDQSTDMVALDNRERELFGLRPEEFSVHVSKIFERVHPEDFERVKNAVDQSTSKNLPYKSEFRVIHPDGQVVWLAGLGQMVEDHNHGLRRMIGVNFDITSRKRADYERDKYTRMENMAQMHRLHIAGEFAALLAHQLNQPLTAIRSFAEAGITRLRRGKIDPQQMRETLEDVVAQSDRAAGSIRDLRKFLARQPQDMVRGDLNVEVNAACSLLDIMARGHKVHIVLNLAKDLPTIAMRPSQIEQVIINLMENAMYAIGEAGNKGGKIKISTSYDESKGFVMAKVEDSGPGLSADAVGRVFDPLYTTKKNGIGMGLSISRSVIEDHGGNIWAEAGSGGRFFFTLPVQK